MQNKQQPRANIQCRELMHGRRLGEWFHWGLCLMVVIKGVLRLTFLRNQLQLPLTRSSEHLFESSSTMSTSKLKIYGVAPSQPCRAVMFLCAIKNQPYDLVKVNPGAPRAKRQSYIDRINPSGNVPGFEGMHGINVHIRYISVPLKMKMDLHCLSQRQL